MPKPKPGKEVQDKIDAANADKEAAQAKPFMISVTRILSELNSLKGEAKSNVGEMLANAFKWDAVASLGKARSDEAWKQLEDSGIIDTEGLAPGTHVLVESPKFYAQALVTQPVKRFNSDAMADLMVKKFKCSRGDALMLIEEAKKAGKSTTRLSILER